MNPALHLNSILHQNYKVCTLITRSFMRLMHDSGCTSMLECCASIGTNIVVESERFSSSQSSASIRGLASGVSLSCWRSPASLIPYRSAS